jgi:hypothetical protein
MRLVELYARSEREAELYSNQLRSLGEDPYVTIVENEPDQTIVRMPAIRTTSNLFEGETAVARLLAAIRRRIEQRRVAQV